MATKNKSALKYFEEKKQRDPIFAEGVRIEFNKLELARVLRQLRESTGTSQAELAVAIGTTQSAIARIESGKTLPKFDVVARIVGALGGTWHSNFQVPNGASIILDMSVKPSRRTQERSELSTVSHAPTASPLPSGVSV